MTDQLIGRGRGLGAFDHGLFCLMWFSADRSARSDVTHRRVTVVRWSWRRRSRGRAHPSPVYTSARVVGGGGVSRVRCKDGARDCELQVISIITIIITIIIISSPRASRARTEPRPKAAASSAGSDSDSFSFGSTGRARFSQPLSQSASGPPPARTWTRRPGGADRTEPNRDATR